MWSKIGLFESSYSSYGDLFLNFKDWWKFALNKILCKYIIEDEQVASIRTRQFYDFEDTLRFCKNPNNPQNFVSLKVGCSTVDNIHYRQHMYNNDVLLNV